MWYIYRITNIVNGKTYIGLHRYEKVNDNYMGSGKILEIAKKKYGIDKFHKEILVSKIPSLEYANKAEILYIALERKRGKGEYNILDGGGGLYGFKLSDEAKARIGEAHKGNQYAKGKNIGNQHAKGNVLSLATRQQMGLSRKGNTNNGVAYIKCLETNEIYRTREWINKGYRNAHLVAKGIRPHCKGKHFIYVNND